MGNLDLRVPVSGYKLYLLGEQKWVLGKFCDGDISKDRKKTSDNGDFLIELYRSPYCSGGKFACISGRTTVVSEEDRIELLENYPKVNYLCKVELVFDGIESDNYLLSVMNSIKGLCKLAESSMGRQFTDSELAVLVSMETEDVVGMLKASTVFESAVKSNVTFGRNFMLVH